MTTWMMMINDFVYMHINDELIIAHIILIIYVCKAVDVLKISPTQCVLKVCVYTGEAIKGHFGSLEKGGGEKTPLHVSG